MPSFKTVMLYLFLILANLACKTEKKEKESTWRTKQIALENETHNQLLAIEKEQGWQLLFNGENLEGWHLYNKADSTAFSAWEVKDGMLYCNATAENKSHGDLVTNKNYKNYELTFDWKIAHRGNSGIFINVQEKPQLPAAWQTGPEYQLLDANHMDYDVPTKRPGCLYGFSPQLNNVDARPTGQWNNSTIMQKDGKVSFYLNGKLTAEQDFTSSEWKEKVAASGFDKYPEFGKATSGKIALQNWYFEVWFRNIKIREL